MIRVVVTGSECTGKTTLARALAEHHDAPWVPEYARQYVMEKGAAPDYEDVEAIARGQVALEDGLIAAGLPLLFQDTDLLSTVVYSKHYYGTCPPAIEEVLADRLPDLYLLAGTQVPWLADGAQRDRSDRRDEMHGLFRDALTGLRVDVGEIRAESKQDRLEQALAAVGDLLDRPLR